MANPLIAGSKLGFRDGKKRILDNVDIEVAPSEIVTIVGPNGSGKTTLLRLLIGAVRPGAGEIRKRADLRIGYTPQKLTLDRTLPLTVDRFLALGESATRSRREEALSLVGLPCIERAQLIDLSGGETQRVLLARALLRKPNLLVLDEPTQSLDQPGEAAFYRLIERVRNDTGCAVLMVSHDLHVVMSAADRVICLNGHICCQGAPTLVLDHPEYRRLFGKGAEGALALYQHAHDHHHHHAHDNPSGDDGDAPSVDSGKPPALDNEKERRARRAS